MTSLKGIQTAVCGTCGERLVKGRFSKNLQHTVVSEVSYYANGSVASMVSKRVDTCPNA